MKNLYFLILFYAIQSIAFVLSGNANNNLDYSFPDGNDSIQTENTFCIPPIATNDTFYLLTGCGNNEISGNLLDNDYDPNGDEIAFYFSSYPTGGNFQIDDQGAFSLQVPEGFLGNITFEYYIKEISEKNYCALGEVIVYVKADCDCDGVSNDLDLDNDNDGILDVDEGNGAIDSDHDGIANNVDIDSDNDGITDNVEWQKEGAYVIPSFVDENKNGWDDAYDILMNGKYYKAEDTNNDGEPDFIDMDSDSDGISDFIEGFDEDADGKIEFFRYETDSDQDGLDDAFDLVDGWVSLYNSAGSNAPLPDSNKSGIRNWREIPVKVASVNYIGESDIYPNPSRGAITVSIPELDSREKLELFLYNNRGALVFQKTITNNRNQVDLLHSPNGTYIVKMRAANFSSSKSLIIYR